LGSGDVGHDETGFNRPVTKELTGLCLMSQGLRWGGQRSAKDWRCEAWHGLDGQGAVRHDETAALGSLSLGSNRT
jgi:hypothetical protein